LAKGVKAFWTLAGATEGAENVELFIKLVSNFSGQGECERLNKQVKLVRTNTRNRQSHVVTTALLKMKSYYVQKESILKHTNCDNDVSYLKHMKRTMEALIREHRPTVPVDIIAPPVENIGTEIDEDADYVADEMPIDEVLFLQLMET
jgi:hypothetical protein